MARLLLAVIVLLLIPACTATVEPPKARVTVPSVSLESDRGGFCPPGHARKGWC